MSIPRAVSLAEGVVVTRSAGDNTSRINAALAAGGVVQLGHHGDVFTCNGQIIAQPDSELRIPLGVSLVKNFATNPFITNPVLDGSKVNRFAITGRGTISAADSSKTGDVIHLYGDDIHFGGFTIDGYYGGRAFLVGGDRMRFWFSRAINPAHTTGAGGIRFIGGTGMRAFGCHIESGDDTYQFVPVGNPSDALFDQTINDGWYIGCTGISYAARLFVALLVNQVPNTGGMSGSVLHSGWSECSGKGATRQQVIQNSDSAGQIHDLTTRSCHIDASQHLTTQTEEILVSLPTTAPTGADVSDIAFELVEVTSPLRRTLRSVGAVKGLTWNSKRLEAPATAGDHIVQIDDATKVNFRSKTIDCTGITTDAVLVGTGTSVVNNAILEGTSYENIPNGIIALNVNDAVRTRIRDNTFIQAGTTGKGARIGTACSGTRIAENNFTGLGGAKITDLAADTDIASNYGYP